MRSITRTLGFILTVTAFSMALYAADDPLFGNWKMNPAKSKWNAGEPWTSAVVKWEPNGAGGIKATYDVVQADGRKVRNEYAANTDGKEYPMTLTGLPPRNETAKFRRIDSYTIERIVLDNGKKSAMQIIKVSKDRKTLTLTTKRIGATGRPLDYVAFFERQ